MTKELENLYDQYYKMFGVEPDGYQEIDYGQGEYSDYVNDIKTAIENNTELPDIYE
ncbi:hypothetical protein H8S51_008955 [Roseburia rectibacter]|uniref:hypothetical protein n=1 Tax=Roseburia rectibacter TaxID=2763062 RepID=UPI001F149332|nr:hypothetical protein [Roseburia rectibacter]UMZ01810.1 hypothetical protein H8S51_008955 [Roseburia rectibacter]